jgi:uncharacterized protein (TIGR00725 family)
MIKQQSRELPGPFPNMTVGVMGSAGGVLAAEVRERLRQLGAIIARRGYVLITGACPGLPHDAVLGARSGGGVVVGISPALNLEEHIRKYHSPTRGYDSIVYTGSGLMGREIENIRTCDVVILAGGRSGTLGEFAIAYDEGKVIGVLTGTGGITEHLSEIVAMMTKETGAIICYDADPGKLMDKLEAVYRQKVLPQYLLAIEGFDLDGILEP